MLETAAFSFANCMSTPSRVFVPGEIVTVEVRQWFEKQEGSSRRGFGAAIEAAPFSIDRIRSKRSPCW
jgi:hypothetical protein